MSFLEQTATYLAKHFTPRMEEVLVITPNKRTGIFLTREVERQFSKPGLLPRIITIEEFIQHNSINAKGDELELNLVLYDIFHKYLPIYKTFEEFYYWGEMLIRDFSDIDKNLVNAKDLFQLMMDEKEIDRQFQYLLPEQIEVIKKFWQSFSPPDYDKNQKAFIDTWSILNDVYNSYNNALYQRGIAYDGMMFREVSENIIKTKVDIPYKWVAFVGFHILSVSEEKIFRFFHKNKKGRFFWDVDNYYTETNNQTRNHEAGSFLRKYIKWFPGETTPSNFLPGVYSPSGPVHSFLGMK